MADTVTWKEPWKGTCGDPGPWGTRCTEDTNHRYAHYDAGDDSSWTDDVMDDWLEDHPEYPPPADYIGRFGLTVPRPDREEKNNG